MLQNLDDLPDEVLEFGVADRLAFARFYSHWTFRRDARRQNTITQYST